ncbi:hypothetical protein JS533_009930 [Bifidobacterium amazonense]|uniref:Uncharacterized protein n=1 Tax=Bifidobacterium amazonense TaxID=2809027 RepID=A0ABS9VXE4_9BIFI|nr:hypothetical protein [Bifidobacterium amazonense]MCH9276581.1 hypothetical protein [Bifidobacterium amazonense]
MRETALWRESRGVETLTMPLFVTNGNDELHFRFIRRTDADRLTAWLDCEDTTTPSHGGKPTSRG